MSLISTGFGKALTALCLLATVACSLVAFFTEMDEFVFAAMVFALVPVVITYSRQRDRPSDREVHGFVQRHLRSRPGWGALTIQTLRTGVSSILYGRRGYVPFRARAQLSEPLFERVNLPWSNLDGLTPRRIETMRKQVDALVEAIGAEAVVLRKEMPPDPFVASFLVERVARGRTLNLSGAVTAVPEPEGWRLSLEYLNHGRRPLEHLGRPQVEFGQSFVLGSPGAQAWLSAVAGAWQEYARKLAALQESGETARFDHGEAVVLGFFRHNKAGSVFHGIGQSVSGQHPPTHFFLELRSIDAATRTVVFTLRNDGSWENSRRFHGTVSYDAAEKAAWIHGVTERADSCRDGGPLVGATNGFSLDFHFFDGAPAWLSSLGGDVSMRLEEVSRSTLRDLRTTVYGRKRRRLDPTCAGPAFAGRLAGAEQATVTLHFIEPSTTGRIAEAKLESAGWSGLFLVQEIDNPYAAEDADVVLWPASGNAALPSDTGGKGWKRVLLNIAEDGFEAKIDTAEGALELTLLRQETPAPGSEEAPSRPAVAGGQSGP